MPTSRSARLAFALLISGCLFVIGRNLYHHYLNNQLAAAIQAKNVPGVLSLLKRGADPNFLFSVQRAENEDAITTPILMVAMGNIYSGLYTSTEPGKKPSASKGNGKVSIEETIVCLLVEKGADLRIPRGKYFPYASYLDIACDAGSVPVLRCLLKKGADPNAASVNGSVALQRAIDYGSITNTSSTGTFSPRVLPGQQGEMNPRIRHAISREMVQLLREQGARLSLYQAVELNDMAALKALLVAGTPVNQFDKTEGPALCGAATHNNLVAVKMLMDYGADPNAHNQYGQNALALAAGNANVEMTQMLLAHGANPNLPGAAPLCVAAEKGNLEIVNLLLAHGANVNEATDYATPLRNAILEKHVEVARTLLAHGANPLRLPLQGKRDASVGAFPGAVSSAASQPLPVQEGLESALTLAIENTPALVPLLVEHSANLQDKSGSALKAAVRSHRLDLVQKFLKSGANVNPLPPNPPFFVKAEADLHHPRNSKVSPFSPLAIAACEAPECEAPLLRAGAKLGPDAPTVLLAAAQIGRGDMITRLLPLGAEVNGVGLNGETALTEAISYAPSSVSLLLEKGANPNYVTRNQLTPLAIAAIAGNTEAVRLLLAHGADVNAHPLRNHTALYYAHKKQSTAIIALLEKAGATDMQ